MNEINDFFKIIYDKIKLKNVLEPPVKAELIDMLSTINVDSPGVDNTDIVKKIADSLTKSIKNYEEYFIKNGKSVSIKFLNALNGGYHLLNVFFSDDIIPGCMDSIEIYIPVKSAHIIKVVPYVYKFLLTNKISFSSKISNFNRSDNFIIYVYDKKDAERLINFCNQSLKGTVSTINPFIYKIGYIGVSKQLNGISYNVVVASLINEYIEECILNQRKKSYDAIDFQNFVNEKYKEADNYIDKSMYYIVAMSLYTIISNKNILNYFEDEIELKFDYEYFNYFEEIKDKKTYKHENVLIDENNNFKVYLKLQALNCLNKIHIEQYKKPYKEVKKINKKFTYKILEQLDYMLDKKSDYNIKVNYINKEIYDYIPYLYGYMAYNYKSCNVLETKKLINIIKDTIIKEKNKDNNKIYYEQEDQRIVSSIPIINTINGAVAIDIIDNESLMCNIYTLKRKENISFLNVYINADINLLIDNKSYKGKRYRYAVAGALLNKKRCNEAINRRKKDFSALFLDTKVEISNYL